MVTSSLVGGFVAALLSVLAVMFSAWWSAALIPVAALWGFSLLFFRNPRRHVPSEPGVVVSPADGVVWDVEELSEDGFLGEPAVRIGIFLSVFDVHVNRAPCASRVEWTRHREGAFHDARSRLAADENESCSIALRALEESGADGTPMLVRQVSGAVARRIVCPLEPGMELARGGLIGMIKYGSRTEFWVTRDSGFRVEVKKGDRVRGGASVLGRFEPRSESALRKQ